MKSGIGRTLRYRLWVLQRRRCYLCQTRMPNPALPHPRNARAPTIDHVRPRALGGSNLIGNLLLAHAACNHRKGCRMPMLSEVAYARAVALTYLDRFPVRRAGAHRRRLLGDAPRLPS